MKTLLFPGQSSQFIGMSLDLYQKYPEIQKIFEQASDLSGFNIKEVIENKNDNINQTNYLQIALFVASVSCFTAIEIEKKLNISSVKYLMGHSLGEYMALYIGNSITFENAIKILKKRSELMSKAEEYSAGKTLSMASILGVPMKTIQVCLDRFFQENKQEKDLFVANYNTDSQIVLSGNLKTIESFKSFAKDEIRKIINLPVSSAFHSVFMKPAAIDFALFLKDFTIQDSEIEIIMNNSALPQKNGEKLKQSLIENLTQGVQWWPSIKYAIEHRAGNFIQIGGKEILINMIKKENVENVNLSFVNSLETLNNF